MAEDSDQDTDLAEDTYFDNVLDQPPVKFFEAAEQGKEAVAEYLESDHPFSLYTRAAMALWLRGELKLPKGRPKLQPRSEEATEQLRLAHAVRQYHELRHRMRKGQDNARIRGTAEETTKKVAERYNIPLNQFEAQLRRGKNLPPTRTPWHELDIQQMVLEMYAEWLIARNK